MRIPGPGQANLRRHAQRSGAGNDHATCAEALDPNNLGAFRDVFRFEGTFTGEVAGVDATGNLTYAGVTRPGGSIDANINLRADGAKATLHTVNAQLGVGGTYCGVAVTKD